jgi:Galactose oxidase, central domain
MESKICEEKSCENSANYCCKKCDPIAYFCEPCGFKHANKSSKHMVEKFVFTLNQKKKQKILRRTKKIIDDLNEFKKDFINIAKETIKKIQYESRETLKLISDIQNSFLIIFKKSDCSSAILKDEYELLKKAFINEHLKKASLPNTNSKAFSDWAELISNEFLKIKNLLNSTIIKSKITLADRKSPYKSKLESLKKSVENSRIESLPDSPRSYSRDYSVKSFAIKKDIISIPELSFIFFPDGKRMKMIEPNIMRCINIEFDHEIIPIILSTACKVDNGNYFYNIKNQNFILDLINRKAYPLLELNAGLIARGCTYKDSTIYIFGGSNKKAEQVNECHKFSQSSNFWMRIANLPKPSRYNSASNVNGHIYVVGINTEGILYYDEYENKFINTYTLPPESKVICENWILVNKQKYIWEISGNTIIKHFTTTPWPGDYLAVSCAFRNENFIYFIQSKSTLMRLDVLNKRIERIKI